MKRYTLSFIFLALTLGLNQATYASNFSLDFQQARNNADDGVITNPTSINGVSDEILRMLNLSCNRPGEVDSACGYNSTYTAGDNGGNTPMLLEKFRADDGRVWFHISIGHPEYGFAQDVFIMRGRQAGGLNGTNPGEYKQTFYSMSRGDTSCAPTNGTGGFAIGNCNASDPLGTNNGNDFGGSGSANPSAIVMRQVIGGTWSETSKSWSCEASDAYCQEFIKSDMSLKPLIRQDLHDAARGFDAHWSFDMTNSNYLTDTVAGEMVNQVTITDPTAGATAGAGDFDFATHDYQKRVGELTGGRFTYIDPVLGIGEPVSSQPYQYWDGHFELDQRWEDYAAPDQSGFYEQLLP